MSGCVAKTQGGTRTEILPRVMTERYRITFPDNSHVMRNGITASKRCYVSRPHKQFRLYRLLADCFMEILLHRIKRKFNEGRPRAI